MKYVSPLFAAVALTVAAIALIPAVPSHAEAVAAAPAKIVAGKVLRTTTGKVVGAIYDVTKEGAAEVILDGALLVIPASTISEVNGKLVTSLSTQDLYAGR